VKIQLCQPGQKHGQPRRHGRIYVENRPQPLTYLGADSHGVRFIDQYSLRHLLQPCRFLPTLSGRYCRRLRKVGCPQVQTNSERITKRSANQHVHRHHHGKHNRRANGATDQKRIVVLIRVHAPPQKAQGVDVKRRNQIRTWVLLSQEFQRTRAVALPHRSRTAFVVKTRKAKQKMK
jgi:hypothetical protein